MWQTYLRPDHLDDLLGLLSQHAGDARLIAGGTDVLVELQRDVKPTATLLDLTAIPNLKYVREDDAGIIRIGALATHNDVIASAVCAAHALPLALACWEVGAPQIRTRATVAGNLVTASPANDTITPLLALDAEVVLVSVRGERVLPLSAFYTGLRRTALAPDELLREIRFPALRNNQRGVFLKLGLRGAQAISVINIAIVVTLDGDEVENAHVALGCVAPTVIRARSAEQFLRGKRLDARVCAHSGELAAQDASPIDDLRGTAVYRRDTVRALVAHGLERFAAGTQATSWVAQPILLETPAPDVRPPDVRPPDVRPPDVRPPDVRHMPLRDVVQTTINGQPYRLAGVLNKTLLDALREDAGLTGTKEGCAEGECGACTVWLNGQAVMSCLVPAAQAHGGSVTTIEGLAPKDQLHPLQQAFIACGAVQCGFCIPGMLMAGAKLLDESPHPTDTQTRAALSGNICRCTGYRKILDAMRIAGGTE
jgi:xanthine dehydrogenase iron-sulfur cluster and FAD-binding subunit A